VRISEQNINWPSTNWTVNYTCLAVMRTMLITSA